MDYLEYLEYDLAARIYTGDKLRDYGDGKWITVGKRDENKNLEGSGTHIFVKGKGLNARIVKGPAGIAGKRMKHLLYNHIKNVQGNKSPNKSPNSFKPDNADLNKVDFYQNQSAGTKISSRNNKDRSYYKKNENGKWDKYKWDSQKKKFVKAGANLSDKTMAQKGFSNKAYSFTKGVEQNNGQGSSKPTFELEGDLAKQFDRVKPENFPQSFADFERIPPGTRIMLENGARIQKVDDENWEVYDKDGHWTGGLTNENMEKYTLGKSPISDVIIPKKFGTQDFSKEPEIYVKNPQTGKFYKHKAIKWFKQHKVQYNSVKKFDKQPTEEEIINRLCGGDKTGGSCASLAMAYIANKAGYDVLDFRGGISRQLVAYTFQENSMLTDYTNEDPRPMYKASESHGGEREDASLKRAFKLIEEGKEYFFGYKQHAAIVRRKNGRIEFLELQSSHQNGWFPFRKSRFGHGHDVKYFGYPVDTIIDVEEAAKVPNFLSMMGYINTPKDEQQKGPGGTIK